MTDPAQAVFASLLRGDRLPSIELVISAADVRAYLDATGEPAARWQVLVPPLMLDALMLGVLLRQAELPPGLMHTGQEHESRRAVRIGEPLRIQFRVASNAVRSGAIFAVFEAEARAGGTVVATLRASVMAPRPAADGAGGTDAEAPR